MNNVFAVIGESRTDPDLLLVVGADGLHYEYQLSDGTTAPVDIDDQWAVDLNSPQFEEMFG